MKKYYFKIVCCLFLIVLLQNGGANGHSSARRMFDSAFDSVSGSPAGLFVGSVIGSAARLKKQTSNNSLSNSTSYTQKSGGNRTEVASRVRRDSPICATKSRDGSSVRSFIVYDENKEESEEIPAEDYEKLVRLVPSAYYDQELQGGGPRANFHSTAPYSVIPDPINIQPLSLLSNFNPPLERDPEVVQNNNQGSAPGNFMSNSLAEAASDSYLDNPLHHSDAGEFERELRDDPRINQLLISQEDLDSPPCCEGCKLFSFKFKSSPVPFLFTPS